MGLAIIYALLVADAHPQIQYVEGWVFNGDEWIQHAWNRINSEEFDLTYQIHCDLNHKMNF
ncbi:hypothetical protein [Nostoc sp. ChiVER01]|uniref:hypothetical protein n=1 Tax=Nostoc sp. ChiVER01 TaxID=3075382 RepID=UPI002AD26666|nr:hypothetical protein [Nostoc sp. ChiVER01]